MSKPLRLLLLEDSASDGELLVRELHRAGFDPGSVPVDNELFFRLVTGNEHGLIQEALATALRERRPYAVVHHLVRPDGQPLKMIGTAHDITELRRACRPRCRPWNVRRPPRSSASCRRA